MIDKLVLEYGLNPADKDNDGNTPLHIAASFKGRVETVRHLISKHSADVDCTNNQNNTPLMRSCAEWSCACFGYANQRIQQQLSCPRLQWLYSPSLCMEWWSYRNDRQISA